MPPATPAKAMLVPRMVPTGSSLLLEPRRPLLHRLGGAVPRLTVSMLLSELGRKLRASEDVGPREVSHALEHERLRAGERHRRERRRDAVTWLGVGVGVGVGVAVTVQLGAIAAVDAERVGVERELAARVAWLGLG